VEDKTRDLLGQVLAVLMVCGLIALVAWFADGYEPAVAGDAATDAPALDAATDAMADAAVDGPAFVPTLVHTALFGAVVESSERLPLHVGRGCILLVAVGPARAAHGVRLVCEALTHETLETASAVVEEATTTRGPVHRVRFTSTPDSSGRRISIDTSRETILVMTDEGRARLRVDPLSVARPGEAFDPEAPQAPARAAGAGDCHEGATWTGVVLLEGEELEPLTLAPDPTGAGLRLELFDARTESMTDVAIDCEAGTATMRGGSGSYEGRFGPAAESLLGQVSLDEQRGLFWLRREVEGSSAEAAP
jgi:hypothetical protein